MNLSTISSVSWLYEARRLIMLDQYESLRNSAPVKGAIKGVFSSAATGVADRDVGVPTSPIRANTPCPLMSSLVLVAASSGS